jgi:tubulin-folding cofactor B
LPSYFIFIIFLAKTTVLGSTSFQPGIWIGIEYDEPLGKNNGTVQGVEYFKCRPNHGAFVRPTKVTVGDFPEEDLFNTDDELEEM